MEDSVAAVVDVYHQRIAIERSMPRDMPPGGRDGGQDQRVNSLRTPLST
jgi:hypothetical protein